MKIKSSLVSLSLSALLISACSGGAGGGGSAAPAAAPAPTASPSEQAAETPIEFPKTFRSTLEFQDKDNLRDMRSSDYSKYTEKAVFGCLEAGDGKDFTFIVKQDGERPEDLKIKVTNAYFRDAKKSYKDLDVKLDGYSKNKWLEFNSAEQSYQTFFCDGNVERVKNYIKGFIQCGNVYPEGFTGKYAMSLEFECDIVQR